MKWVNRVLGSLAVVLALSAPPVIAKGHAPSPDLTLRHATMGGKPFVFFGQNTAGQISVSDTTENIGKGRAGPTLNVVWMYHDGHLPIEIGDRAVPALRPGQRNSGEDSLKHDLRAAPGDYKVVICVNAKRQERESRLNNCELVRKHFYIAPRLWQGSLSGVWSAPGGGTTEPWRSTDARLDFEQYTGSGKFLYVFSGTVSWSDNGTAPDGCTFSGSGSKTYSHDDSIGNLTVNYLDDTYVAQLQATAPGIYTITETCPQGGTVTVPGPLNLLFWAPSPLSGPAALPFGSVSLVGSPAHDPFTVFTWNITAREPSG
jgi:hypothetical protein